MENTFHISAPPQWELLQIVHIHIKDICVILQELLDIVFHLEQNSVHINHDTFHNWHKPDDSYLTADTSLSTYDSYLTAETPEASLSTW